MIGAVSTAVAPPRTRCSTSAGAMASDYEGIIAANPGIDPGYPDGAEVVESKPVTIQRMPASR